LETTVAIDDELIDQAKALSGIRDTAAPPRAQRPSGK
jgi:hypothetical protein